MIKTVVDVHLPEAIAPGEYVQFKIAFQTNFPETQARSGWKHDFVLGGQWFPRLESSGTEPGIAFHTNALTEFLRRLRRL